MVVVCDPVNPFGTVQTRDELEALLRAVGRARGRDPGRHHPLGPPRRPRGRATTRSPRVAADHPGATVLVASGLAHGYGMAGARIGALGGAARAGARLPAGEDRRRPPQHQPPRPGRRGGGAARRGVAAPRRGRSSGATSRALRGGRAAGGRPGLRLLVRRRRLRDRGERPGAHRGPLPAPGRGLPGRRPGRGRRHHHDPPQPERPRPVGARALRRRPAPTRARRPRAASTATPCATCSSPTAPTAAGGSPPWWRAGA